MFDADRQAFYKKSNGDIASLEEVRNDLSLIDGEELAYGTKGKQRKEISEKGKDKYFYKNFFLDKRNLKKELKYQLKPNEEIRFYYNWRGDWFWSDFDKEPPE